jgi:hypothetical protein
MTMPDRESGKDEMEADGEGELDPGEEHGKGIGFHRSQTPVTPAL